MKLPKQATALPVMRVNAFGPLTAALAIRPSLTVATGGRYCEVECQRLFSGNPEELRRCLNECWLDLRVDGPYA